MLFTMPKAIDLTGQIFGKWKLITRLPLNAKKKRYYVCQCVCGVTKEIEQSTLTRGASKSCGCSYTNHPIKHGFSKRGNKLSEYSVWQAMKDRCNNINNKNFHRYGGRGITYDPTWQYFENFIKDMGFKPTKSHSIERINNDLGYSKNNCKWATPAEQSRNYSYNVKITYNDETLCLVDWADKAGINRRTFHHRYKNGWSIEKMLTTKPGKTYIRKQQ